MSWWFWILLWVALTALALLFVVLLGIKTFREFMATLRELEAAGATLTRGRTPDPAAGAAPPREAAVPGIFLSRQAARTAYEAGKTARREARRRRRIAWRRLRKQPQNLRDLRHS